MDRRDFLGRMLGTFVAVPSLGYFARDIITKEKILLPPKTILPQYRTGLRLNDGSIIQGTGIKDILAIDNGVIGLVFNDIEVLETFTAKGVIIFETNNKLLKEHTFGYDQPLNSGDVLRCTYSLCNGKLDEEETKTIKHKIETEHYYLENISRYGVRKSDLK